MRTRAVSAAYSAYSYSSEGVSDYAAQAARPQVEAIDTSVSCGQMQATLFQSIVDCRSQASIEGWDGDSSRPISETTVRTAISLLFALPEVLSPPTVAAEATGEISFEWYRDKRNVAIITVEDQQVRWAALVGGVTRISGSDAYSRIIPEQALDAVRKIRG